MKDDVKSLISGTLFVFLIGVATWVGFLFINACGFTLTCKRGDLHVDRTPVPTLIPATLPPASSMGNGEVVVSDQCRVLAVDFIGAWVTAGSSENEVFQFTDANGQTCESSFEEVKPLFVEANLWSSFSCVSCHSVDVAVSPAQLDLSTYAGIISGSRRADADSKGTDILAAGNWEKSILYDFISNSKADIPGHNETVSDLMISVGTPLVVVEIPNTPIPTITPTP